MADIVPKEEAMEWYTKEPGHLSKGGPSGCVELKNALSKVKKPGVEEPQQSRDAVG